jgi:predicted P-loop ATPase
MAKGFEHYLVGWAEGRGKNLAKSKNRTESWASLKKLLSTPAVTPERRREFDKMSKEEQDKLKSINGWISGAQCKDGHRNLRNVMPRNLLTIDIDYAPDTITEDIEMGLTRISHFEACWHSSRRHSPDAPRVRLFMPMKRKVKVDEYTALVRFIGWKLDPEMKLVDQVSYRPAQMMFKPSCSTDDRKHYFFHEQHGTLLDPDALLAEYNEHFGDYTDLSTMPKHPDEELRKRADKAEDPRTKAGPVGVFCRTYDIFDAMEKFLPGTYIPGDAHAGNPRFTYAGSTSSNGAVVYDDGLFLYSHHGHDPVCDMNVNAFDLVRIHLYGDQDEKAKEDATPGQMPSFKAMTEMLGTDKPYQAQKIEEKFDFGSMFDDAGIEAEDDYFGGAEDADEAAGETSAERATGAGDDGLRGSGAADTGSHEAPGDDDAGGDDPFAGAFDDVDPEEEPERPAEREKARKPEGSKPGRPQPSQKRTPRKDWFKEEIEFTENAEVKSSLHNVATIIQNDKRLLNVIWYNEFDKNVVLRKSVKPQVSVAPAYECRNSFNGDRWQDFHDITIRAILESPHGEGKTGYGMRVTDRDLVSGITLAARMTPFHPIRDYLLTNKWDGVPRIDTFLIRHLGLADTEYSRQISRLPILASVVRIFEPGHKFDYAVIIQGPQGIGKSTLIRALYGDDWFGELHADLGEKQKVAEEITGKWGVELPELGAFHKSDHNKAKGFMRRVVDDVRMAYDRRVTEFPRQCVCWGTTNDGKYLKDPTGNRSYWPAHTTVDEIDANAIRAERDQIWAEAVELYFSMREKKPDGDLWLSLTGKEALREAQRHQEDARTEELHEIWADAITDWLEEPITLQQLKSEIGVAIGGAFADDGGDSEVLVVRTAFRREDAVKGAIRKQHGVVTDHSSTQNIAKALDMLKGWQTLGPDGSTEGSARRRIMGVRGRWIFNLSASAEDRYRGYTIVTKDEDDDFDVI